MSDRSLPLRDRLVVWRGQIGVNRCDDLRALAHGGSHALDRAGANIADRKHAAAASCERWSIDSQFSTSTNEALLVQHYIAVR